MKRRIALYLCFLFSLWVTAELVTYFALSYVGGRKLPISEYSALITVTSREGPSLFRAFFSATKKEGDYVDTSNVLHPYLGYVADPQVDPQMNEYGFPGPFDLEKSRSKDVFTIGIFGGSVAQGITHQNRQEYFAKVLQPLGKQIDIHVFALGGYKQPQQLFALAYFLTLGAHFDLVINLDGFNEVALPPVENISKGVYPFFPRSWDYRSSNIVDESILLRLSPLFLNRSAQMLWAKCFAWLPARRSPILTSVWKRGNDYFERNRTRMISTLSFQKSSDLRFVSSGPPYTKRDESSMYNDLTRVWAEGSKQMYALAKANGARYFHFLQPNQYVEGSKPMNEEERKVAIRTENNPLCLGGLKGYKFLRDRASDLRNSGIEFHDLSMVFQYKSDPLYTDDCCHFNTEGYHILFDEMARTILQTISNRQ